MNPRISPARWHPIVRSLALLGVLVLALTACAERSSIPSGFDFSPSAEPASGEAPLVVSFSHGASVDLAPEAYTWSFGDGSDPADGVAPEHTFTRPGTYKVTVRASDPSGNAYARVVAVEVTRPQLEPTATPDEGLFPLTVGFQHGASVDLDPSAYTWTFGDGSDPVKGLSPQHTYDEPGTYVARLSVVDPVGFEQTGSVEVRVTSDPPTADFSFANPPDAWPTDAAPRTVTFDGSSSSDDLGIATYSWQFLSSGASASGSSVTRTFYGPGTYQVRLEVRDEEGQSATVTKEVTVSEPPEPAPDAVRIEQKGLQTTYPQGASASGTITIEMDDPEFTVRRAVPFLNVVEAKEPWEQAMRDIASSGSADPEIFQKVYTHDELEAGLTTDVTFELRNDAPKGDYVVVIQLFNGTNTNPHSVRLDNKFAHKGFPLTIE